VSPRRLSNIVGFDDAPFERDGDDPVLVVGALFSAGRLDGVLSTSVERDGADATERLIRVVRDSRFAPQIQLILTQGIAFGGFNVIDLQAAHEALGIPVMAVARHAPNREAIRQALLDHVPGGAEKWAIIDKQGLMEPLGPVFVQRAGIDRKTAERVIRETATHSHLPEPLRTAHLVAGGVQTGESRHRP